MDRETVITHLQIIHTWASFARERNLQFFTAKHLEDIAQWAYDAITLLGEQKERIETLESLRRIEQETIKALQMGTERERKVTMAREYICADGERKGGR